MFVAVAPKSESKGILSGFDEEMENEDYEDRTPENLEIIANNLRGDIRSMDERYLELAQLVGEAAFDTPEEVVALMQSQMGQGEPQMTAPPTQGGIASLGTPPAMSQSSQGVMQGVAEESAPEQMFLGMAPQQPLQMANGGIVYRQSGSPPLGETAARTIIDDELFRQATERRPGMLSRMVGGARDFIGAADDRITNFLSRQMQTTGPTTASGKPIPFVDKQGRFYQPVGGTNPNMPSRGFPMASKLNFGRLARFGGPQAFFGGMATGALIESDPSRGQLYGSMFDLETGAGAADRPGRAITIPVTRGASPYEYIDSSTVVPLTDAGPSTAAESSSVPPPPPFGAEGGFSPINISSVISPEFLAESSRLKEGEPKEKTLKERVQDKLAIYKDVLGDDENARQAQALFLLAEASLNVAGATGRSIGERVTKGVKGLPSGLGALGAEAERNRRAVAAAALSSVESEIADERKILGQQQLQLLRNSKDLASIQTFANFIMKSHGITDPREAFNIAILTRNGDLKLENGILVDRLGKQYGRRDGPIQVGDIGYLDPQRPDVEVTNTYMPRATPEQQSDLLKRRSAAAEALKTAEDGMRDLEKIIGPLATFSSVLSRGYTTLFGPSAVGFTDTQRDSMRQEIKLIFEKVMSGYRRNESRESVYAQQLIGNLFEDPNNFFNSSSKVFGVLNNVRRQMANEISTYDSQLYGTPIRRAVPFGTGEADSPIDLRLPGAQLLLDDYFRVKGPRTSLYVLAVDPNDPNKTNKIVIEGGRYMAEKNKQQGAPQ